MREYTSKVTGSQVYVYQPGAEITGEDLYDLKAWYAAIETVAKAGETFKSNFCARNGLDRGKLDIFLKNGGVHFTEAQEKKAPKNKAPNVNAASDLKARFA